MCSPQDPPFHASPAIHKTPSWGTNLSIHKTLIWKKNGTFPLQSKYFFRKYDNFHLKKLKFDWNFRQKTWFLKKISVLKPLFLMKSAHKPPLSLQFIHSQAPKFGNLGRTYLPEKKLSASPGKLSFLPFCSYTWRRVLTFCQFRKFHQEVKTLWTNLWSYLDLLYWEPLITYFWGQYVNPMGYSQLSDKNAHTKYNPVG